MGVTGKTEVIGVRVGSDANRATLCSPAVESDYCADEEDNIPRGTGRMVVVVASFRPPSIPAHGPAVGMLSVSGGFSLAGIPKPDLWVCRTVSRDPVRANRSS